MWEFDLTLLVDSPYFDPNWGVVDPDPTVIPPAPVTVQPAAPGVGDDILTDAEADLFELGVINFIDGLVDPVQNYGSDQNSYMDQDYDTAPMPPGFMADFGSYLSASSLDALGFHYYDYLTADIDPEFLMESDSQFIAQSIAQSGASFGTDFQTYRNGVTISFDYHPGAPGGLDSEGVINVNGGYYTASIISTSYLIPDDDFGQHLIAGGGTNYRTFNNLDWGSPVPLTDDEFETMRDINGNVIYRPANIDIDDIYRLGVSHRGESWAALGTNLQILFSHGGRFDFQRQGGTMHSQDRILPSGYLFHPEYVSFSTVAIGAFARGAGISLNEILSIQNSFAYMRSSFPPGTPMDPVYTNLPARNVANTRLGYVLAAPRTGT